MGTLKAGMLTRPEVSRPRSRSRPQTQGQDRECESKFSVKCHS